MFLSKSEYNIICTDVQHCSVMLHTEDIRHYFTIGVVTESNDVTLSGTGECSALAVCYDNFMKSITIMSTL